MDLSVGVMDKAMRQSDNSYKYVHDVRIFDEIDLLGMNSWQYS